MSSLRESFLVPSKPQSRATPQSKDICPKSVVPGPSMTTLDSANANPGPDSGNPLGVGTLGDGRKPFSVR